MHKIPFNFRLNSYSVLLYVTKFPYALRSLALHYDHVIKYVLQFSSLDEYALLHLKFLMLKFALQCWETDV